MKGQGLLVAVVLLALAVAGYAVASRVYGFPFLGLPAPRSPEPVPGMYNLGLMVTNLKDPGRFIRVQIELELYDGSKANLVSQRAAEIKTDIYALLRAKTYDELVGEDGLRNLQADLVERLNKKLAGLVKNVYFSEFLIQ
ncbi:MAG: flagellar basal body-associated FliL family protein [Firmicutes bacterium]|nr:flagellar basal body-associated FliL family protein [Candidatus Fermentithermobacillaceae bacterium]